MLNGRIRAVQRAFGDVQARPAAGVERVHILDELTRRRATHLDVGTTSGRGRTGARAIDLRAWLQFLRPERARQTRT